LPEEDRVEETDVLIVGAGISGIGMAWHLKERLPGKRFILLEGRERLGGTWDLFRYPGIRSDSDMFTLGYRFRPWTEAKAIADGPSILRYLNATAEEGGITPHIRYRHKVTAADWDSATARWTLAVDTPDGPALFRAPMLLLCAGYYSYERPHNPPLPGEERFDGPVFHAQHWPDDLDWKGKRVAVIGSGATAVTIVPVLAETAAHVTMIQRSPTWMVSRPSEDRIANLLRAILPGRLAYALIRWRNIMLQQWFYGLSRRRPERVRMQLLKMLAKDMPDEVIARHFTPSYKVWDQRLCLVPDGNLFRAVNAGRASVATGHIAELEPRAIRMQDGSRIDADILVKATGLTLQLAGGIPIALDGVPQGLAERFVYKGMMFEGLPNLISVFGYTNASWTLKADLTAEFACRLIAELDLRDMAAATPVNTDPQVVGEPFLDFTSGYVQRALAQLPKQGSKPPWRLPQSYFEDRRLILEGTLDDGVLRFTRPVADKAKAERSLEPAE
jgi:cation diffusion facilitator CzcD-associated flavoprotein CzcO